MHEWKMPLKYWGMLSSLSGPLGLGKRQTPWSGHHPPALICGFSGGEKISSFIFGRNIVARVKIVP
jgi:hypothetical protein